MLGLDVEALVAVVVLADAHMALETGLERPEPGAGVAVAAVVVAVVLIDALDVAVVDGDVDLDLAAVLDLDLDFDLDAVLGVHVQHFGAAGDRAQVEGAVVVAHVARPGRGRADADARHVRGLAVHGHDVALEQGSAAAAAGAAATAAGGEQESETQGGQGGDAHGRTPGWVRAGKGAPRCGGRGARAGAGYTGPRRPK
jgi:hypothetical protein